MSLVVVVGRLAAALVVLSAILGGLIAIMVYAYMKDRSDYAKRARRHGL